MPLARQLAVKYLRDRTNFDLEAWLKIRGRGKLEVEMKEVLAEARKLDLPAINKKSLRF